jgi:methyl-accepting chemotaxis protein
MTFLRNLAIGTRLALGFAVTIALAMAIALIAMWRLADVSQATHAMMASPLAKERLIGDWYSKTDSAIRRTTAIAKSADTSLATYFAAESKQSTTIAADLLKQIEPLLVTPQEKAQFAKIMEQRKIYGSTRDDIARLKAAGDLEGAMKVFETAFVPGAATYQAMIQDLVKLQRAQIDATAGDIDAIAARSRTILVVLATLVLVFGSLSAWALTIAQ